MAAAWVTLRHLGQDGYLKLAKNLQNTVKILIDGCNKIEVLLYFFSILKQISKILWELSLFTHCEGNSIFNSSQVTR